MDRLVGKVAVVTGAASGIGQGIAEMFAAEGAKVVLAARRIAKLEQIVDGIREKGGDAIAVPCDVTVKDDIKSLVKKAHDTYGNVTTLVNSAGVLVHGGFLEHTDADYDKVSQTNFRGTYWAMQEFIPELLKCTEDGGQASVINIASISVSKPETNAYLYGAFKAATNIMTKNIVREYSCKGIRFNVVCPGPVNTELTPAEFGELTPEQQAEAIKDMCPVGRPGLPEDIAYGCVWLASDEAWWVTGSTIAIDGGASCMGTAGA